MTTAIIKANHNETYVSPVFALKYAGADSETNGNEAIPGGIELDNDLIIAFGVFLNEGIMEAEGNILQ